MPSTGVAPGTVCLRACYAMPSTDIAYGGTRALGGTAHWASTRGVGCWGMEPTAGHVTRWSLGGTRPGYAVLCTGAIGTDSVGLSGTDSVRGCAVLMGAVL
eukprot:3940771-Rhodomonas_salina.1